MISKGMIQNAQKWSLGIISLAPRNPGRKQPRTNPPNAVGPGEFMYYPTPASPGAKDGTMVASSTEARELLSATAGKLAKFKLPSEDHIFFVSTPLPRGATGKIQKRDIRADLEKQRAAGSLRSKL